MKRVFKTGDCVKLTEHGVKAQAAYQSTKLRVDWAARRGVVQSYTRRGEALVVWDGRSSVETVPLMILERA